QPGQHFIEDFFASEDTMPGFSAGMANVSRDEQRHIGFGVKVLAELLADEHPAHEECKAAVVELLREVLPYGPAVFYPPNMDREYTECYGFSLEDIFAFGLKLIRQRWRAIGYPTEEMPPGVFPFDPEATAEEVAENQVKLMEAGILGPPETTPQTNPEMQRLYFDVVKRAADPRAANGSKLVYQWRFTDADPWHLILDNGSTRAEPGEAPNPTLTLEAKWADFVSMSKPDANPMKMVLTRRIRPRGPIREIARLRKVFN
ncbi:MAG: ribonucleoside-diphosphate reductase beta chain, partial [Solirubrobacterales bacterium]|nr:ribonucleoside-diphosphate reductase beta chain [Solirubrobacterales bacterium]